MSEAHKNHNDGGDDEYADVPFELTELDRTILKQTDEEFTYHDWEDIKNIVERNDLGLLKRKPSDLIRYIAWTKKTKNEYGSVGNYIGVRRLQWLPAPSATTTTSNSSASSITTAAAKSTSASSTSVSPSPPPSPHTPLSFKNPTPFGHPDDYRILRNDWPYGFTPEVTHLVVWLKTPIAVDPATGFVTEASRKLVDEFVRWKFVERLRREAFSRGEEDSEEKAMARVLWCKNWTALQSVRTLEHIHVLVKDVPDEIIVEWTGDKELVQG